MARCRLLLLLLCILSAATVNGQTAPVLRGLYPLGAQRGTVVDVDIDGTALAGTYAVWLGADTERYTLESAGPKRGGSFTRANGIQAHIESSPSATHVKVQLAIAPDAPVGTHVVYLVAAGGLSNGLSFWVSPHPVTGAISPLHATQDTALPVTVPVALNGRLPKDGQIDYYRFAVEREQTLAFHVVALQGQPAQQFGIVFPFDPQLSLYDSSPSWLDAKRTHRLLFHEERTQGSMPHNLCLTHHFTSPGQYVVGISSTFARGGSDFAYLLDIAPAAADAADPAGWAGERLTELRAHSLDAPGEKAIRIVPEKEPNDKPGQANSFAVPAVLVGSIAHAGDVDCFKFRASAGQKLAFEVATPKVQAPQFHPRIDVLDPSGKVVLTNLHIEGADVKQVSRLLLGTLQKAGEYCVQVRDLTSSQGSPDHRYWLLVRPQVPHAVAEMQTAGGVNLRPGAVKQLTLSAPREEGFAGDLALTVEGLPRGVKALFGTVSATVVLCADADANPTVMPQIVRITGRPMLAGKLGAAVKVQDVPLMVVKR